MHFKFMWISSIFALGILTSGHAFSQETVSENGASRSIDADTQERLSKAKAADDAHQYRDAYLLWKQLAEQGVPEAQTHIGMMYRYGERGLCPNDAKAVEWLQKAADQGFPEAYRDLGQIYDSDPDLRDPALSLSWYEKGAEAGDAPSQAHLFRIYWNGQGVSKDPAKAVSWLEKAAVHPGVGAVFDAYILGNIYSDGKDVPQDNDKALHWYLVAANGGLTNAQFAAARLLEKKQDYAAAYRWYALVAASKGASEFKNVDSARDRTAAQLTPAQRAEADSWVANTKFPNADLPPPVAIPTTAGCPPIQHKP